MATYALRFPVLALIACLFAATIAAAYKCPPHDPSKQRCCNGALKPKNPDTRCCGSRLIRPFIAGRPGFRRICCGGRGFVVDSHTFCCGGVRYTAPKQKCCGARIIDRHSRC